MYFRYSRALFGIGRNDVDFGAVFDLAVGFDIDFIQAS